MPLMAHGEDAPQTTGIFGFFLGPRSRFLLDVLALALPWTRLSFAPYPINHDVAWFFYVARGVLHGGVLYRDFIEPNAPLASLSLLPAVFVANSFHLDPALAVEVYVLAICSALSYLDLLLLRELGAGKAAQLMFLLAFIAECVFLPRGSFGQREHIIFVLLAPYAIGALCRYNGRTARQRLAFLTGLLAAIAIGLKPPFLFVPCVIEAVLLFHLGSRGCARAQTGGLVFGCGAIAALTVLGFPAYLRDVVPLMVGAYAGYNDSQWLWSAVELCLPGFAAAWLCLGLTRDSDMPGLRALLAATFVGCLLAFIVQGKGWFYQLMPAYMTLLLTIACACGAVLAWKPRSGPAKLRFAACVPLAVWGTWLIIVMAGGVDRPRDPASLAGVAREVEGTPGPFVILSTNVVPGFPLALVEGHVWASRYPCMILLPGLINLPPSPFLAKLETDYRASIVSDLQKYRPGLVMIPMKGDQALPPDFDILAWLLRDPGFAGVWRDYKQGQSTDGFRVFHGHPADPAQG